MKSDELATIVGQVVKLAQSRITGVGKEQYEQNSTQKFESMSIPDLLEYFEEELLDQINYAVMNYLRVHNAKLEFIKMIDGLEKAGFGSTPVAEDLKHGKVFHNRSFLVIQREVTKELPFEEKPLNLA